MFINLKLLQQKMLIIRLPFCCSQFDIYYLLLLNLSRMNASRIIVHWLKVQRHNEKKTNKYTNSVEISVRKISIEISRTNMLNDECIQFLYSNILIALHLAQIVVWTLCFFLFEVIATRILCILNGQIDELIKW